jgi:hypothetical protein
MDELVDALFAEAEAPRRLGMRHQVRHFPIACAMMAGSSVTALRRRMLTSLPKRHAMSPNVW